VCVRSRTTYATHLHDATHSKLNTVHPATLRLQLPWPLQGVSTLMVPGHGSSGGGVGDGTGDGVGDRDGDDLDAPAVAAEGGVGEATGLGLRPSTASQWRPVVPVSVQSQTGPTLPTVHTPGPHISEEQAVTWTAPNTHSTTSTQHDTW
jgi:hypothetical protein